MEIDIKGLAPQDVRQMVKTHFALAGQRKLLTIGTLAPETEIESVLAAWVETIPAARWVTRAAGIAPVLAAGLAANIEIETAPTVGRIWRFAGFDPTVEWEEGKKCPWNPSLKAICLRIGYSIAASGGGSYYGKAYRRRLKVESQRNDNRPDGEKLPAARVAARARRWTIKLFLAHYHQVAWTFATGTPPAKPYAIGVLGRENYIAPPDLEGGVR